MNDNIESVLFICRDVNVFKLPPRASVNVGYKAAEWENGRIWSGRLRIIETTAMDSEDAAGSCAIRLEDAQTGDLFAEAPYDRTGKAIEAALDSSRYFVLAVRDPSSGQRAFLGLGFTERTDAFDFNVALQDWTRRAKAKEADAAAALQPSPHLPKDGQPLDLSLKAGERISINIGGKAGIAKPRSRPEGSSAVPLLPPPPSKR